MFTIQCILMETINGILSILTVTVTICTGTLAWDFQFYHKYYKAMVNCRTIDRFTLEGSDTLYEMVFKGEKTVCIRWDGAIKLGDDAYLYPDALAWLSPYSLFWLIRFRRYIKWLKKNPKILFIYTSN